jgi:hypothetical protein
MTEEILPYVPNRDRYEKGIWKPLDPNGGGVRKDIPTCLVRRVSPPNSP